MAKNKNNSKNNTRSDRVICNRYGEEMYVDYDTDIFPFCQKEGYLMDVEENIII